MDPSCRQFALVLEERRAHRDAEVLDLLAPRDDAVVVVREHRDRHADERRVEDALARAVERRAVYEGEQPQRPRRRRRRVGERRPQPLARGAHDRPRALWSTNVTTPHTTNSCPSHNSIAG